MNIRSAKAKGRKLQQTVRNLLRKHTSHLGLMDGDIESNGMGQPGRDIILSPFAQKIIKFSIECKNQEKLNLNESLNQAEYNSNESLEPLLIIKKNRSKIYSIIIYETLLGLLSNVNVNDEFKIISINKERFNIWEAIEQAESDLSKKNPLIIFRRLRNIYCVIEFGILINLLYKLPSTKI